ncbi:MAG: DUF2807 domain-containing protein [Caulobacter sp.]|nr:DUF2807 domain-containing protein [Caulobacter sp.]
MRAILVVGVAAAALMAAGAAQAKEPSVEIKDAVARVTVVPEAGRTDIKVVFKTTNGQLPLTVRTDGDKTIVDGGLGKAFGGGRIKNCTAVNGRISVNVSGVGKVAWEAFPEVIVYTPADSRVAAGGAVFGSIGRSSSLSLSNAGCGDWTVANVAGELQVNLAGSGDLRAGSAGSAKLNIAGSGDAALTTIEGALSTNIAGSGDIDAGAVRGPLAVNTMGSGDVEVTSVAGDISANLAGSGDVKIRGGKAGAMSVKIAGSGDVLFGGSTSALSARIAGSGDVRVGGAGAVSKSVAGSGDVVVGPVAFSD